MVSHSPTVALAAAALALACLAALAWQWPKVRGTTLVAPWWWSVGSVLSIAAVEVAATAVSDEWAGWIMPARYAAAMTSLCPAMALLGAKRPQDKAWQFVVLTLLAVLSMPSLEWLFLGDMSEIHPARIAFSTILIAVGVLNGLPTGYWRSSLLVCGAQIALIAPHLAFTYRWLPGARGPLVGLALLAIAWGLIARGLSASRAIAGGLNRAWLDFRDAYGAVWALRVMQRMNASAAMYDWTVRLSWRGFESRSNRVPASAVPEAVEDSLRTLLRRFVSQAWIDRRLTASG